MRDVQFNADAMAIALSAACLIHCLVLPLTLTLLPALAVGFLADEQFHRWLLVIIIPTSVLAIGMGCWKHRSAAVALTSLSGLAILLVGGLGGHEQFGETGEKLLTTSGALIVAASHVMNQRLCRRAQSCAC